MNRRDVIGTGLGAVTATAVAGALSSSAVFAGSKSKTSLKKRLIDNALDCIKAGEFCITACLAQSNINAASIQACRECIAVCEALVRLDATQSRHLRAFSAVCAEVCRDCEIACKEDGDDEACRTCAEACAACAESCEAYAR